MTYGAGGGDGSARRVVAKLLTVAFVILAIACASEPAGAVVGGAQAGSAHPVVGPRVVGGAGTNNHSYDWMVRLSTGCDGVLVAERVVLTAGHCVNGTGRTSSIEVTGGSANLNGSSADTIRSVYVKRASDYRDAVHGDDWAVIQLANPFALPLLRVTPSDEYDHGAFRVLGWGSTSEQGAQQTRLRSVVVPFVSDADCAAAYQGNSFVKSEMICAGDLDNGGVDACQGDSGGPMIRRDEAGNYIEVGIVSWGYGCGRAGYPGVYTQLSAFRDAIAAAVAKLR